MIITGELIKNLRTLLGLTQEEFGSAIDLTRETINKMENGSKISKASKILIQKYIDDKKITSEQISQKRYSDPNEATNEMQDDEKPLEKKLIPRMKPENETLLTLARIIEKQQETIHYLSTGESQGGGKSPPKNVSG